MTPRTCVPALQRTGELYFNYVNNSPIETQIIDGNPDKREFTYYQLTYGHSLPKTVTVRYGQRTQHSLSYREAYC